MADRGGERGGFGRGFGGRPRGDRVKRVKKVQVEGKVEAWPVCNIYVRFKWEDAIIEKATSSLKKIETKLKEKSARATEEMQNEVVKAVEKRAAGKASRGTKADCGNVKCRAIKMKDFKWRGLNVPTELANVMRGLKAPPELANLMRAVDRPPVKRR